MATLFRVRARERSFAGAAASLGDFTLDHGQPVAAEIVLDGAEWSPYCLDFDTGQAVFVELPKGTDLSKAPFVYQLQFELAQRVLTVPFAGLSGLAGQLPPLPRLSFLFSTGRCGSTLASRMLAAIPGVWSLSEPDIYTNLAFARFRAERAALAELLQACTRLVCRPPAGVAPQSIVVKPRSEAIVQAGLYASALPGTDGAFLYRGAEDYTRSLYKFVQRVLGAERFFGDPEAWKIGWPLSAINAPLTLLERYFPADLDRVGWVETMALGWALRIDAYHEGVARGARMLPMHYDDLNADRRTHTALLLQGCGIATDHVDFALRGFDGDAHGGTRGASSVPAVALDTRQVARVTDLMQRWGQPDLARTRLSGAMAAA